MKGKIPQKSHKSQSSLEYLMTYGWAVIIIAVALSALYVFGVMNPSAFVSQQCLLPAGFTCAIVGMGSSGIITVNIYQSTGSQITITSVACSTNDTFANIPAYAGNQISLRPGANVTLSLPCYTGAGTSPVFLNVGSVFTGYLLLNYTQTSVSGFQHTVSGKLIAKTTFVGFTTSTSPTSTSSTSTTSTSSTSTSSTSTTTIMIYSLTMNAGTGGTVTPVSGNYQSGNTVPINAIPNTGYYFTSWAGTGPGNYIGTSDPATVTMNGAISETASFALQQATLACGGYGGAGAACSSWTQSGSTWTCGGYGGAGAVCSSWTQSGSTWTCGGYGGAGATCASWTQGGTGTVYSFVLGSAP